MKWNCNIVKDMYNRVIRRKFGLLCNDDLSNEVFIQSYLNRLDCTPIDVSCYGDNEPCPSITTLTSCNLSVGVSIVVNSSNQYEFITSVLNEVGTPVYNWTYNPFHWLLISNTGGTLVLQPLITNGSSITTMVSLVVSDDRNCKAKWNEKITYRGGCTDTEAINYSPLSTFDNGTCYYLPLSFTIGYVCEEDTSGTVTINITGGLPPYTIIGTQNNTNLPNGSTYSSYVVDSLGNSTPIQSGTISCPFVCDTIEIIDNFDQVCQLDEFNQNTGFATVYCIPSGGTAPYTIEVSINGGSNIPFVNGSTVSNLDELVIYITDANDCTTISAPYLIDCPPYNPGGSGTCEDLESEFEAASTEFYLGLRTTDRIITGGGYSIEYDIAFGVINLPSGYTTANISNVAYSVENISPVGLIGQNHSGWCTICSDNMGSPAINGDNLSGAWGTVANFYATYNQSCIDGLPLQILRLQVDAVITFTNEDTTCNFCLSTEIELEYLPCDRVFLTNQVVQNPSVTICEP